MDNETIKRYYKKGILFQFILTFSLTVSMFTIFLIFNIIKLNLQQILNVSLICYGIALLIALIFTPIRWIWNKVRYDEIFNKEKNQDFSEKLRKLEIIKQDGLITKEEYERKRQEILNDKW